MKVGNQILIDKLLTLIKAPSGEGSKPFIIEIIEIE
jgi:hypothetical protein